MRRIIFDKDKIDEIRNFMEVEHNTVAKTANKFGVSADTIRRIMYENNIAPGHPEKRTGYTRAQDKEKVSLVVGLYASTDIPMERLCKEVKLEDYMVQSIIRDFFTEEYINERKSRLYRLSKLGDKNPMKECTRDKNHNWIGGVVSDGQGYLMVKKPEWYTGRKGSDYIFQHSIVMCEALGITEIPKGFAVHHIDHNPLNNDISNLALVQMGAHSRLHQIEKKMCIGSFVKYGKD